MKAVKTIIAAGLVLSFAGTAVAGLSAQEIKELSTTLTPIGAEKAGNKEGTIPPYTGGLTTAPAGYVKGSGLRADPYAAEKPLFSINAGNAARYADKLSEGAKALLKKYADYRIDVYPTHRSAGYPKTVFENTLKHAGQASASEESLHATQATYPFPIPKNGVEAMWNHLVKYTPTEKERARSYTVDASGRAVMASELMVTQDYTYWTSPKKSDYFFRLRIDFVGPPRRDGEAMLILDSMDYAKSPRKAWQYLPGQRRVKLAPEIGWDTPDPTTSGATTFDDSFMFNGPMDRYEWKLLGKKEMYIPYNDYKLAYHSKIGDVLKPHFVNPDYVRWELHRVWVVEATLKPGKRHIYKRRLFYLDEDSWQAAAADNYDARGQLFRSGFNYMVQNYDHPAPLFEPFGHYDLISGQYNFNAYSAETGGMKYVPSPPERYFSSDSLAGSGIR